MLHRLLCFKLRFVKRGLVRFIYLNTGKMVVKGTDYLSLRLKNLVAVIIYFVGAHVLDVLYVLTCKEFSYFAAMGIMALTLGGMSVILVSTHGKVQERYGWDVLGLEHLNRLRDEKHIPQHRTGKRLTRWFMRRRLTIFLLGSCLVGPPVVTILLRKPGSPGDNIFYIISGTLISAVVWVTFWKGFWNVWVLYIQPAVHWTA
jgi:hypothetical protein